jgi:hypothetical protein
VAALADQLWKLKAQAGDPSFAEMSTKLGAAASKSSLAAATRGQVLPSWETTWEFVRVLAVDRLGQDAEEAEREWRERWERARNVMLGVTELSDLPDESASPPERTWRGKRTAAIAVVSGVVVAGIGAVLVLAPSSTGAGGKTPEPSTPVTPVVDDSVFEGDVTYPDGTAVDAGTYFTKVWRIRNTGSTRWQERYLTRINSTPCEAPEMVPSRQTEPGPTVDISGKARAASTPGRCENYGKMTDAARTPLMSGKRPIFLDVQVTKS